MIHFYTSLREARAPGLLLIGNTVGSLIAIRGENKAGLNLSRSCIFNWYKCPYCVHAKLTMPHYQSRLSPKFHNASKPTACETPPPLPPFLLISFLYWSFYCIAQFLVLAIWMKTPMSISRVLKLFRGFGARSVAGSVRRRQSRSTLCLQSEMKRPFVCVVCAALIRDLFCGTT